MADVEVEQPFPEVEQGETSAAAAASPAKEPAAVNPKKRKERDDLTAKIPDELALPLASITRIIKSKLPEGMMVGADTKKAIMKICSLFILYVSTMCAPKTRSHE